MRISVTDEHIALGKPKCSSACPIWMAIKDRVPSPCHVLVARHEVDFDSERAHVLVPLPESAIDFIRRFDKAASVEPFEFELPEPWRIFQ